MLQLLLLLIAPCYTNSLYHNTINNGDFDAPDEMINYASYISSLFHNQTYQTNPENEKSERELEKNLRERFFGTVCGKDMNRDQFIDYLRRKTIYHGVNPWDDETITEAEFQIISIKPSLMFHVQYNMTDNMHVKTNVIIQVDADKTSEEAWSIREIVISGGCVDSDQIDLKLVNDGRSPDRNVSPDDIVDYLNEHIVEVLSFTNIGGDAVFEGIIETDPMFTETYNISELAKYMRTFNQRYEVLNDTTSVHGKVDNVYIINEHDHVIIRMRKVVKYRLTGNKDLWEFQIEAFEDKTVDRNWKFVRMYLRPLNLIPNRPIYELTNATKNEFERIFDLPTREIIINPELTKNMRIFRTCSKLHTSGFDNLTLDVYKTSNMSRTRRPKVEVKVLSSDQKYEPHISFRVRYTYRTENNENKQTDFVFYAEYDYKYDIYHIRDVVQSCNQFGEPVPMFESRVGEPWSCGTENTDEGYVSDLSGWFCGEKQDGMNSCCYVHDRCYDDQLGQKYCDDNFCACLKRECEGWSEACDIVEEKFCEVVRKYGHRAYKNAGLNAELAANRTL